MFHYPCFTGRNIYHYALSKSLITEVRHPHLLILDNAASTAEYQQNSGHACDDQDDHEIGLVHGFD